MKRQAAVRAKAFEDTHPGGVGRRQAKITPKGIIKAARKIRKAQKRATRPVKPFKWHA